MTNIYILSDPRTPLNYRYVGITIKTLKRRLAVHISESKRGVNTYKCNWIRSLLKEGIKPIITLKAIVEDSIREDIEIKYIKSLRNNNYDLTNGTSGGDGMLGFKHTTTTKHLMSIRYKGIKRSQETCEKISQTLKGNIPWNKGKKMSIEFCKKNSDCHKGLVSGFKGKHHTEENKRKQRDAANKQHADNKVVKIDIIEVL